MGIPNGAEGGLAFVKDPKSESESRKVGISLPRALGDTFAGREDGTHVFRLGPALVSLELRLIRAGHDSLIGPPKTRQAAMRGQPSIQDHHPLASTLLRRLKKDMASRRSNIPTAAHHLLSCCTDFS